MAKNRAEWASGHRQLTRIGLSDGCGGELIPVAVQSGYHRNKFEGHLGNVGLNVLKQRLPHDAEAGEGLLLAILSVYQAYFHRIHSSVKRVDRAVEAANKA